METVARLLRPLPGFAAAVALVGLWNAGWVLLAITIRSSIAPPSRGTNGPEQTIFPWAWSSRSYARWRSTIWSMRSSGARYFSATKA
jgi:hypothetical protein